MDFKQFSIFILFSLSITPCIAQKENSSALFLSSIKEVVCISSSANGTQMLRGFGRGRTSKLAKNDIMRNVVFASIFEGIQQGSGGCESKPILFNANAFDNNRSFFNYFFSDSGDYLKFVSTKESPRKSKKKYSGNAKEKIFSMIVQVDHAALRQYLMNNNLK